MVVSVSDDRYKKRKWVSVATQLLEQVKPEIVLEPLKTALFIIDMQKGCCLPNSFRCKKLEELAPEAFSYYMQRLKVVVPNLRKLQAFFRDNGLEVVQCVVESLTQDGRDRLPPDKALEIHRPPNSEEAEVLDELKPLPDEIVFTKTTSGMFTPYNSTYHILRSMGIEHLVFGGCITEGCVESTVRAAFDLFGYTNVLVEDCCATFSGDDVHVAAIRAMGSAYAEISSTNSVISHLTQQLAVS